MKYFCFLDETGDHGLTFIDKNFPILLLCGVIIREDYLRNVEGEVKRFKIKYFNTDEVILHSREIRKCEGPFQILFDLDLKAAFYKDLNSILSTSAYSLIGSGINKEKLIKKYGKVAKDPYSISLSFILERLIFFTDRIGIPSTLEVLVEERGKREDQALLSNFNAILDRGTHYITSERFKARIKRLAFHAKRDNIIGLQIADLCAYPLARHILNPQEPYIPFKIIDSKIYKSQKGRKMGWGLKIFP